MVVFEDTWRNHGKSREISLSEVDAKNSDSLALVASE